MMDDLIRTAQAHAAEAARRVADAIERDERVANAADTLSTRARMLGRSAADRADDARRAAARTGALSDRARDADLPQPRGGGMALAIGLAAVGGYVAWQAAQKRRLDARPDDDAPETSAKRGPQPGLLSGEAKVAKSVTINKPVQEVYAYWRDFDNLPTFMENLENIRHEGDALDWDIKAPGGATVAVKTRVTEDVPGNAIGWESTEDSAIKTKGRVTFTPAPADRGTIVTLNIDYHPPAGRLGQLAAKLMRREPAVQAAHELRRLRMLLETGEIAISERTKADAAKARGDSPQDHKAPGAPTTTTTGDK